MSVLEVAKSDVFQIEESIAALNRTQTRRLQVFFAADGKSERTLDLDVVRCSNEVVRCLKQCENRLKVLQDESSHETDNRLKTLHTNAMRCIIIQLNELYATYRTRQKEYLQTLMQRNSDSGFDILNEGQSSSGKAEIFGSTVPQQMQIRNPIQSASHADDLQQRHSEIQRVVRSVTEIHALFEDVSRLVIEQGSMLDRIDVALETAAVQAEGAKVELKKTEEYQKNGLAKRISVFLLGMNGLMTVLLILKHWPS